MKQKGKDSQALVGFNGQKGKWINNIDRLIDGNIGGLESRQGMGQMGRAAISNHMVIDDLTEMETFQLKNLRCRGSVTRNSRTLLSSRVAHNHMLICIN